MTGVINNTDKAQAIRDCEQFLRYFPYRYCAIVQMPGGHWGHCTGKTKARMNRLAKEGCKVWMVTKS